LNLPRSLVDVDGGSDLADQGAEREAGSKSNPLDAHQAPRPEERAFGVFFGHRLPPGPTVP
jgi:hypothetical protein